MASQNCDGRLNLTRASCPVPQCIGETSIAFDEESKEFTARTCRTNNAGQRHCSSSTVSKDSPALCTLSEPARTEFPSLQSISYHCAPDSPEIIVDHVQFTPGMPAFNCCCHNDVCSHPNWPGCQCGNLTNCGFTKDNLSIEPRPNGVDVHLDRKNSRHIRQHIPGLACPQTDTQIAHRLTHRIEKRKRTTMS
jgi:hypothetical protein